jgi:hypothetical protein
MRKVSDKIFYRKSKHILCSVNVFEKRAVYEIMLKNMDQATENNIIRRMRFACWITNVTKAHSGYVAIIAFPR